MPLIANWDPALRDRDGCTFTENEWGMGMSHLALGW